ncbi:CPBP family intramembrane glutamic endopeptidase [Streptomyces sp. MMS24-I2-30]|uniref:CPBP family intramembrane glutamic endopeptidase n=1 Tax=Streptomyces sp. MMS24-I2-30 TaxID=3351564 RepID=UPI00389686E0
MPTSILAHCTARRAAHRTVQCAAFRGVVSTALTRYGAWVSVIGSTVVFALAHGINLALIPAIVVGAINGILLVRTKSVWPGVIVHAVNNGVSTILIALAG